VAGQYRFLYELKSNISNTQPITAKLPSTSVRIQDMIALIISLFLLQSLNAVGLNVSRIRKITNPIDYISNMNDKLFSIENRIIAYTIQSKKRQHKEVLRLMTESDAYGFNSKIVNNFKKRVMKASDDFKSRTTEMMKKGIVNTANILITFVLGEATNT
jgi:hypothetical protein